MSEHTPEPPARDKETPTDPEEYGSLSVEDDPQGTVDPGDLAGSADESDDDVVYQPQYSEEDVED